MSVPISDEMISDFRRKFLTREREDDFVACVAVYVTEEIAKKVPEFFTHKSDASKEEITSALIENARAFESKLNKGPIPKFINSIKEKAIEDAVDKVKAETGKETIRDNIFLREFREIAQILKKDGEKFFYGGVTVAFVVGAIGIGIPFVQTFVAQLGMLATVMSIGGLTAGAGYFYYKYRQVSKEMPQTATTTDPKQHEKKIKIIVASTPEVKPLISPSPTVEDVASTSNEAASDEAAQPAANEGTIPDASKQKEPLKLLFVSSLLVEKTPLGKSFEDVYRNGCARPVDDQDKKTGTGPRL